MTVTAVGMQSNLPLKVVGSALLLTFEARRDRT